MSRDVTVTYFEEQNNQYTESVGKIKSFLILKQVVCKITTVFSWVKKVTSSPDIICFLNPTVHTSYCF